MEFFVKAKNVLAFLCNTLCGLWVRWWEIIAWNGNSKE